MRGALVLLLIALGFGAIGFVWHQAAVHRSDQLEATQRLACERLNRVIRDYNHQYELIFAALGDVALEHPDEPVSHAVVAAFQSPGFPLVREARC